MLFRPWSLPGNTTDCISSRRLRFPGGSRILPDTAVATSWSVPTGGEDPSRGSLCVKPRPDRKPVFPGLPSHDSGWGERLSNLDPALKALEHSRPASFDPFESLMAQLESTISHRDANGTAIRRSFRPQPGRRFAFGGFHPSSVRGQEKGKRRSNYGNSPGRSARLTCGSPLTGEHTSNRIGFPFRRRFTNENETCGTALRTF